MAEMSGIPKIAARQRAADVLYQVGLDEERYRLIKGFSTGMKQRVKLAQSIVHDPQLVFLDEPTAGMDPPGRDGMLELVDRIHRMMGMTVVLSSHILEDIERVCDYVVIIDGGKLVLSQPIGNRQRRRAGARRPDRWRCRGVRHAAECTRSQRRANCPTAHEPVSRNRYSASG